MIKTEELGGTSLEPTGGFSHIDILVASQRFMTKIAGVKDLEGANVATTLEELAEISEDHLFEAGNGFTKFTAVQDKSGLESPMIGDGKMFENKLSIFVKGSDAKTLGGIRQFKSERALVVLAREAGSGNYRQLGHAFYPCTISEASPKVAPEYEGENGTILVFMDKNKVAAPIYKGAIVNQPTV